MSAEAIVQKMMENDAFSQWLGIKVDSVSDGSCQLSMTVQSDMLNGFGIAHGGITYSLADSALAFASNGTGVKSVSIHTSIKHLSPLVKGDVIIAIATREYESNRYGHYIIKIKKEDTVVAIFDGTVFRRKEQWDI